MESHAWELNAPYITRLEKTTLDYCEMGDDARRQNCYALVQAIGFPLEERAIAFMNGAKMSTRLSWKPYGDGRRPALDGSFA